MLVLVELKVQLAVRVCLFAVEGYRPCAATFSFFRPTVVEAQVEYELALPSYAVPMAFWLQVLAFL